MGSKVEEAKEHLKAAEKALKTSVLKWKPDFDSAADEYSQAAQCYRIARDPQNSKECYLKACEFYEKNRSFFHAAKSLESAIIVTKEVSEPEELFKLAEKSCHLYQQHGSGDSGANILDKTAKIIESKNSELAFRLFQRAADVSATESGQHQAAEYISKASRLAVKMGKYDDAVDCLRREVGFNMDNGNIGNVGRLAVAIVLVQLARGDPIAAEKAYKEWGGNCEVPEMQTVEQLLAAFDEEDPDSARRALASPFIKHMDVEFARLALTIPLPEVLAAPTHPAYEGQSAAETVAETATNDEASSIADTQYESTNGDGTSYAASTASKPVYKPQAEDDGEEEDELC